MKNFGVTMTTLPADRLDVSLIIMQDSILQPDHSVSNHVTLVSNAALTTSIFAQYRHRGFDHWAPAAFSPLHGPCSRHFWRACTVCLAHSGKRRIFKIP